MKLALISAPALPQQQVSGQGGFAEGCCPGRVKSPSQRKPRECLLCAVDMPQAQGNVGESVHLPYTLCLPAATH